LGSIEGNAKLLGRLPNIHPNTLGQRPKPDAATLPLEKAIPGQPLPIVLLGKQDSLATRIDINLLLPP